MIRLQAQFLDCGHASAISIHQNFLAASCADLSKDCLPVFYISPHLVSQDCKIVVLETQLFELAEIKYVVTFATFCEALENHLGKLYSCRKFSFMLR